MSLLKEFLAKRAHGGSTNFDPVASLTEFGQKNITPLQLQVLDRFLHVLQGRGILGNRPGEGKTLLSIALSRHLGGKWVIGVPSVKNKDWCDEYVKWSGVKPFPITSGKKIPLDNSAADYYVISHTLGKLHPKFLEFEWDGVIVDEAHVLKGNGTIVSSAWVDLMRRAKYVVMVTGTPLKNGPMDVFNLLSGICPSVFVDRKAFSIRYAGGYEDPETKEWIEKRATNIGELAGILDHFMVRNIDLSLLPPSSSSGLPQEEEETEMGEEEGEGEERNGGGEKEEEGGKPDAPISTALDRILYRFKLPKEVRLPVADPNKKYQATKLWRETNILKQPYMYDYAIEQILAQDTGRTAAVFFWHIHLAKKFAKRLKQEGIEYVYVDGKVPIDKRQGILDPVSKGTIPVAIMTIPCCSESIELTPAVTLVIMMELPWSPATLEQAEGRAHRKGQRHTVLSIWMVAENTYDQTLMRRLDTKTKLFSRIVDRK